MRRMTVHVHPRAREDRVEQSPEGEIQVWTRALAVEGQANAAVCRLVADWLGVRASDVSIAVGSRSRTKLIDVDVTTAGKRPQSVILSPQAKNP